MAGKPGKAIAIAAILFGALLVLVLVTVGWSTLYPVGQAKPSAELTAPLTGQSSAPEHSLPGCCR